MARESRPTRYESVDNPVGGGLRAPPTRPAGDSAASFAKDPNRAPDWIKTVWSAARKAAADSELGAVLALDEIQKIPNWQETVKGLWDADRQKGTPLHVVLLGSAPLLMQQGLTETLAGRFETIRLTHWSLGEMSSAFGFDLPAFLYFGGYPGAAELIGTEDRWRDYVATALVEPNIERDILALERVDKPALLKRLFELSGEFSGRILSYQKMVGQLDDAGNTTTLARYLNLLQRAGLVAGLPRYEGRVTRYRQSSPKLVVLNTALMSIQAGYTFSDARADRTFWGRLVETAVGAHLFNSAAPGMRLYYWRLRDAEVDFVLERGRRLVIVEVKSSGRRTSARGRREFEALFGQVRSVVVGGDGIPLTEFLSVPAAHWFEAET